MYAASLQNKSKQFIKHRGRPIKGYFSDSHKSLEFQKIHDEDEKDYQPYHFSKQRFSIVFDGKIYNADLLRQQLSEKGYEFTTETEVELIAKLFLDCGTDAFAQLRGMFAILIWDKKNDKLFGARDRFGIKPLYYQENKTELVVASEKEDILCSSKQISLEKQALQHYFSFQYVPEPMTLTKGIKKVKPGHFFIKEQGKPILFNQYFHATFQPIYNEHDVLTKRVRDTLIDSVDAHMDQDQLIGSFLSGGIDSSLIVAISKEINPNLKTFSVGFAVGNYSETEIAAETADKLGVDHHAYILSAEEYIAQLPQVMLQFEEPLADPSCVPLYVAAREASNHVDAVLSGEGADEIFGGYNIYKEYNSLKLFRTLPNLLNKALYQIATIFPEGMKGKSFIKRGTTPLKNRYIGNAKIFEEVDKRNLLKHYYPELPYQIITEDLYDCVKDCHEVTQMQYIDTQMWLPGDILLKADRMTAAHGLDLRVPFLDKEVFDIARTLPVSEKIANGTTKWILREAFKDFVPNDILYREKLGFPVPIKAWLKDDLYFWAKRLIEESATEDVINKQFVLYLLDRHAQNKGDYARKIWTVLMFMLWHKVHLEGTY